MSTGTVTKLARRLRHLEVLEPIQPRYGDTITITADDTLGVYDWVVFVNAAAANIVVTLPAASEAWGYYVKRIDTGDEGHTVTVDGNGAEQIDLAATVTLEPIGGTGGYNAIQIISDGAAWWIVASHYLP